MGFGGWFLISPLSAEMDLCLCEKYKLTNVDFSALSVCLEKLLVISQFISKFAFFKVFLLKCFFHFWRGGIENLYMVV